MWKHFACYVLSHINSYLLQITAIYVTHI